MSKQKSVSIDEQIRYHRHRLRKNKFERSISESLKAWQTHFGEGQANNHFIVSMPPELYRKFREFTEKPQN